jgi:phage gp36-like protein
MGMSYVTNADVEAWLGTQTVVELTDDAGAGVIDAAKLDEAKLGAEGEANSYLATRYQVPVDVASEPDVQAVLRSFILDLVSYRLHGRRPPVPADIVRRREEAVVWFGRVASGMVQLPSALAVPENPALGILGQGAGPKRQMTRDTLEDV